MKDEQIKCPVKDFEKLLEKPLSEESKKKVEEFKKLIDEKLDKEKQEE